MRTVPVQRKVSPASVVPLNAYGLSPPPFVRKDSSRTVSGPSVLAKAGLRVASWNPTRASSTASRAIDTVTPSSSFAGGAPAGAAAGASSARRSWNVSVPSAARPTSTDGRTSRISASPTSPASRRRGASRTYSDSQPRNGAPSRCLTASPSTVTDRASGFTRTFATDTSRCSAADASLRRTRRTIAGAARKPKAV